MAKLSAVIVPCFDDKNLLQFVFCKLTWFRFFVLKPSAATDDEVTPLVTAAAAGSSEIVELLLKVFELS